MASASLRFLKANTKLSLRQCIASAPIHDTPKIEVVLDRAIAQRMFGRWAMVLSDTTSESTAETAFLLGFAAGQGTPSARKLYDIAIAAFDRDC
jgi:hypothetical protein